MSVNDEMRKAVEATRIADIATSMGYAHVGPLADRIEKTLSDPYLGLVQGIFDKVFGSRQFLDALLKAISFDFNTHGKALNDAIESALWVRKQLFSGFTPWIYVYTAYRRLDHNHPIWLLAMAEPKRRKVLYPQFKMWPLDRQLKLFKNEIASFQKQLQTDDYGVPFIQVWGKPIRYVVHVEKDLRYVFSPAGDLLEQQTGEEIEAGGVLTIKS